MFLMYIWSARALLALLCWHSSVMLPNAPGLICQSRFLSFFKLQKAQSEWRLTNETDTCFPSSQYSEKCNGKEIAENVRSGVKSLQNQNPPNHTNTTTKAKTTTTMRNNFESKSPVVPLSSEALGRHLGQTKRVL